MKLDDLLIRVNLGTVGWIKTIPSGKSPSRALAANERLFRYVKKVQRDPRGRRRSYDSIRRDLIDVINSTASLLISEASSAISMLTETDCSLVYESEDESGSVILVRQPIDEIPAIDLVRDVLRTTNGLRKLRTDQQFSAVEYRMVAQSVAFDHIRLHFAKQNETPENVRSREQDLELGIAKLERIRRRLGRSEIEFLDNHATLSGTKWSSDLPLLPILHMDATDDQLRTVAKWYESIGSSMFQPLPVDESADEHLKARWKESWAVFDECGEATLLLAIWIRSLAFVDGSHRCDLCYRHIGVNARRFCVCHFRRDKKRLDSREIHISSFYKRMQEKFHTDNPKLSDLFSLLDAEKLDKSGGEHTVKALGLPCALEHPADVLKAQLAQLSPVISGVLEAGVNEHFLAMVSVATEPFICRMSERRGESKFLDKPQRDAIRWLCLENFFRTWYGENVQVPFPAEKLICRGLDRDHPVIQFGINTLGAIALDLMHLRAWVEVDTCFDRFAYISLGEVRRLRNGVDPVTGKQRSFAQVAKQVGASYEAVWETYLYSQQLTHSGRKDRRERVFPGGLIRLAEHLRLQPPDSKSRGVTGKQVTSSFK